MKQVVTFVKKFLNDEYEINFCEFFAYYYSWNNKH